jgi:hypothetical protein
MTSAKVVDHFGLDLDSVKRLRKKRVVPTQMLQNESGKICPHYDPKDIAACVPCLENRLKLKRYGYLADASNARDDGPSTSSVPIGLLRYAPKDDLVYEIVKIPPERGVIYTLAGASRETGIPKTTLLLEIGKAFEDFRIYGGHRLFFGSDLKQYQEDHVPIPKSDTAYRDRKGLCNLVKATKPHQRVEVAEQKALWEASGVLPSKSISRQHTRNAVGKWKTGADGKRVTTEKRTVKRTAVVTESHAVIFKQLWDQDPKPYIEEIKKLGASKGITSAELRAKMLKMDIGAKRLRKLCKMAGVAFCRGRVGEPGRFVVKYDGPCPPMPNRAPGETAAWLEQRLNEGLRLWQTITECAEKEGISEAALLRASRKLKCQEAPIDGKPIGGGRWKVIAPSSQTLPTYEEGLQLIVEHRQVKAKPQAELVDDAIASSPIPLAIVAPRDNLPQQVDIGAPEPRTFGSQEAKLNVKSKGSSEKGEGREKLISALTAYHRYAEGSLLNLQPVVSNELARLADVSKSTASEFFAKTFKGHGKYKAVCRDSAMLVAALKLLNNEFAPYHLFGGVPPGERDGADI